MTEHTTTARKKNLDPGLVAEVQCIRNTRFWPSAIKEGGDEWTLNEWAASPSEAATYMVGFMIQSLVNMGWRVWKIDGSNLQIVVSLASEDASKVITKTGATTVGALALACAAIWDAENA